MKKTIFILLFCFAKLGFAQDTSDKSYWLISPRIGYDLSQDYKNNTPYIDYKGGIEAGISVDKYWNWFGLGIDFDYIKNKPKSIFPTVNLDDGSGTFLTNFRLTEDQITRMFLGIGPDLKYQNKNGKFLAELNTRFGFGSVKGGRTELFETTFGRLNFHAGYDDQSFSAKGQLRFTYFPSENFGIHIGGYYLRHFGIQELSEGGVSSMYYDIVKNAGGNNVIDLARARRESCNCDISSIGVFAGVTFKLVSKKKEQICPVCGKPHYPFCCAACGCDVTITARDKFTKELLNDTDVVLTDENGNITQSGTTNSYGVVVFKNVIPNNYVVKGKLYNIALSENTISKTEFDLCKTEGKPIQKEILYTDDNFIIKGKVVVCNTTTPLNGVSVILKNTALGVQKSTNSDAKGEYIFQALQNAEYTIFGKKANYLSQTETVSTKDYDRNKTLFIKLEICMDAADCGKAIVLKNILYDLDKYFIRDDAKPELNRLVQFMQDNPDVKVELSSHTDSRASDSYNKTLSQNRANAAVDYIVSQGIDRNRLVGKGYGESRLLNKCADNVPCTETEHQINRRTEVKVLCPGEY